VTKTQVTARVLALVTLRGRDRATIEKAVAPYGEVLGLPVRVCWL
jgi:hypothetical protein